MSTATTATLNEQISFALKPGVSAKGLKPEIVPAILAAWAVYLRNAYPFTITSISDGVHKSGSFHYKGLAVDIRLPRVGDVPAGLTVRQRVRAEIAAALGREYDVILESTHIHIEFDPK